MHRILARPVPLIALALVTFAPVHAAFGGDLDPASYGNQLQQRTSDLRQLSKKPIRPLDRAVQSYSGAATVVRPDGARQTATGAEWTRFSSIYRSNPNASPAEVRDAASQVEARARAFKEWAPPSGNYYQPAEADRIVNQLVQTNQISNSASWLQTEWASFKKVLNNAMRAFGRWLQRILNSIFGRITPRAASAPKMPDLTWASRAIVVAAVLVLLFVLVRLLSRSFRGMAADRERESERLLSGEDEELLQLPLDELQSRADRFAAEGDFRQALRHLYLALLVHLEDFGIWHYDTRRTNWEHIAALRRSQLGMPLVSPLSDLTRRFDRVRYGNAECGAGDWQRFSSDVSKLEKGLSSRK